MNHLPHYQLQKGMFLIASPDIDAGGFFRSVILLCEHNAMGSFGIVVNKTLEIDLPEEVVSLKHLDNPKIHVRQGGPVQTHQMMLLHTCEQIPRQTLEVCHSVYLGGDLQFLHQALSSENMPQINLCFGYAGWGPGQLDKEFLQGHWFVCPATKETIFDQKPEIMWRDLLREMGGKYAAISMIPEDLTLN